MNSSRDSDSSLNGLVSRLENAAREWPVAAGAVRMSRAPGIVDVMGGIGEDAGALVLTAATGASHRVGVWPTRDDSVRVRIFAECGADDSSDYSVPTAALAREDASAIRHRFKECGDDAAVCVYLTVRRLMLGGLIPPPGAGLAILVEHDFIAEADLGRWASLSTALADACVRQGAVIADRNTIAQSAASAVADLIGLHQLRKTMSALAAPKSGSLLQMRFHPNFLCEELELPPGVIIKTLATRLTRPTTIQRLIETRVCSEMGHRVIQSLQRGAEDAGDPSRARLSSITPAEYVQLYRNQMPSKITYQQFVAKFGAVRGLDGPQMNPKEVFKIRSRAEHHIYENRRVHEFATHMVRARRSSVMDALLAAGELMYASHWSHSQRCGIGGVETDRLVTLIREAGPTHGLFGAKVTAGGEGGELVVLMRDDERAHAALSSAIAKAEKLSNRSVLVFNGAIPGAQYFVPPRLADVKASTAAAV